MDKLQSFVSGMYNQNKDLFDNLYKEIMNQSTTQSSTQSSTHSSVANAPLPSSTFDFSSMMQNTTNYFNENPEIANQLTNTIVKYARF